MSHLLNTAALAAAEGEHHVNEELLAAAPLVGVLAFAAFILLMIISMSFAPRGRTPEVGEYEDPSALSAREQEMLGKINAPHYH